MKVEHYKNGTWLLVIRGNSGGCCVCDFAVSEPYSVGARGPCSVDAHLCPACAAAFEESPEGQRAAELRSDDPSEGERVAFEDWVRRTAAERRVAREAELLRGAS
jgi:hypothetical protein